MDRRLFRDIRGILDIVGILVILVIVEDQVIVVLVVTVDQEGLLDLKVSLVLVVILV